MLEPVDLYGREELLAQIPAVSVIGRSDLTAFSKSTAARLGRRSRPRNQSSVRRSTPGRRTSRSSANRMSESSNCSFGLHILVYSPWCGPTELPDPVDIHPTAEITGYVVVDESRYRKGWSFSQGVPVLAERRDLLGGSPGFHVVTQSEPRSLLWQERVSHTPAQGRAITTPDSPIRALPEPQNSAQICVTWAGCGRPREAMQIVRAD